MCKKELADTGFIRNAGRALCHECNAKVKADKLGKYVCHKCQYVENFIFDTTNNWTNKIARFSH